MMIVNKKQEAKKQCHAATVAEEYNSASQALVKFGYDLMFISFYFFTRPARPPKKEKRISGFLLLKTGFDFYMVQNHPTVNTI